MDKNNDKELIWGEIRVMDLLKNLYKDTLLEQMSEREIDRMLEDLL